MGVTPAQVRIIAPELEDSTDDFIQTYIEAAEQVIADSTTNWGTTANNQRAQLFMTAHLAVVGLDNSTNLDGVVTSEKVGDIARTYSKSALNASDLNTTSYGSVVASLMKTVYHGPMMV